MTADSLQESMARHESAAATRVRQCSVGILSTSYTGLQELACLLAREAVGMSQGIYVDPRYPHSDGDSSEMLDGLRMLQGDPATEIVTLVSEQPAPDAARRVLSAVRESDKPTVVCFLGLDPRLLWRAGAIPAARLDETALRAAAWVRGWDQALISSMLEEQDDELAHRAGKLARRLSSEQQRLTGLYTSKLFLQEARLMLADVAGDAPMALEAVMDREAQLNRLLHVRGESRQAIVLLDIMLGHDGDLDPAQALAGILPAHRGGPLVIAHLCGSTDDPETQKMHADALDSAGLIVTHSSAAAARLAGMILTKHQQAVAARSLT